MGKIKGIQYFLGDVSDLKRVQLIGGPSDSTLMLVDTGKPCQTLRIPYLSDTTVGIDNGVNFYQQNYEVALYKATGVLRLEDFEVYLYAGDEE